MKGLANAGGSGTQKPVRSWGRLRLVRRAGGAMCSEPAPPLACVLQKPRGQTIMEPERFHSCIWGLSFILLVKQSLSSRTFFLVGIGVGLTEKLNDQD